MKSDQARTEAKRRPTILARLSLVVFGLAVGLLLCELVSRLAFPLPRGYFLHPPNTKEVFHLPASMLAGVPSVARHSTNSEGVRGDPPGPDPEYRILTIGGSTTACGALDAPQTWPARVQTILAERLPHRRVWVGNLGKDGLNTRHHLVTLDRFLPQRPRIDAVVFLVGVNDFLRRLQQDQQFHPLTLAELETDSPTLTQTFSITPPDAGVTPWYRQLGLWRLAHKLRAGCTAWAAPEPARALAQARARRRNSPVWRSRLPDLGPALREYEQNLEALVDRSRARGLRIIFLTQPTLWKAAGMTPAEEATLLWGFVGRGLRDATEYYTPAALAEGMARYNEITRQVCRQRGVECLDLAGTLAADLSVFYDDCHFNTSGAEQVAQRLATHLLERLPFSAAGARDGS